MIVTGRVALVTGAGRRIGRAIAEALAARGARVAVHYRTSRTEAEDVVAAIRAQGGEAESFAADLADPAQVVSLADTVSARMGAVDVLVNNASIFSRTPLTDLGEPAWDQHMAVNLKAPYLLGLRLGLAMQARGAGKIVNIGDGGAVPSRDYLAYAVSKAGLVALTEGLAKVLAPAVQVNCVAPGPILPAAGSSAEEQAAMVRRTLAQRFGAPADIAAAVVFLIEGTDFTTGTTIVVDGGRALG